MYHYISIITWLEQHQITCLFKKLTNFDCPGCGIQRSFVALLNGDIVESIKLYAPLIPILLMFTMLFFYLFFKWKNGYIHLKYAYFSCAAIIITNYSYKLFLMFV